MNFETWWLFGIPVFFGLGWLAARLDIRQLLSESKTLPHGYFKGLNFLLNEQPDKAIDTFIEIVQLDPETAELHFALGNMFSRRGEIDRAIRVHQNLLSRADLPQRQRELALYELGNDFLRGGLLDRSEEAFNKLLKTQHGAKAQRALLEIYQRLKEWQRAIDAAQAMNTSGSGRWQKEISQFYCELAQKELDKNQPDKAISLLEKALAANHSNVRANMLIGDVLSAQGNKEGALHVWRRIEQQSLPHMALVAQRVMEGYRSLGRAQEGFDLLQSFMAQNPSIDLLEVMFSSLVALQGAEAGYQLVLDELRRSPNLLGLDKLLEARLLIKRDDRDELNMVRDLVHGYAQKMARYQCSHCGFKSRQFYWQCPGCNLWETYPPRRSEEQLASN